jgi:formylglycine-generating enzyme required for sulfatase activity
LWESLDTFKPGDPRVLAAAGALAMYDSKGPKWSEIGRRVAQALALIDPASVGLWSEMFRPVRTFLSAHLIELYRDKNRQGSEHVVALRMLADFAADDTELLAKLLMTADAEAYKTFFLVAGRKAETLLPVFRAELAKTAHADEAQEGLAERQARAAIALIRMGKPEDVWHLLQHRPDPRLRSFIINWLKPMEADPRVIAVEFERRETVRRGPGSAVEPTAARLPFHETARSPMVDILFHPETSTRRALILALGTFGAEQFPADELDRLTNTLLDVYRNDVDAGIHGAVESTLRRWKRSEQLKVIDTDLSQLKDRGDRRWYVNGQGQTFSVIVGPVEFVKGSPESDLDRVAASEPVYRVNIPRRFAVATKEVTLDQYRRFAQANPEFGMEADAEQYLRKYSPDPEGPWIGPSWYVAAAYCNWLSKLENLPKDQWCYVPNKQGKCEEGMTIPADALDRTGYRLPTEAEWEYSCRAGAVTSRYYGVSVDLLGKYAWYANNSDGRAHPAGYLIPNDLGLFDMLGNVYEWCQDGDGNNLTKTNGVYGDLGRANETVVSSRPRMFRGGTYMVFPPEVRAANCSQEVPTYTGIYNGLRPVRTLR